jgi:hypothetical protein
MYIPLTLYGFVIIPLMNNCCILFSFPVVVSSVQHQNYCVLLVIITGTDKMVVKKDQYKSRLYDYFCIFKGYPRELQLFMKGPTLHSSYVNYMYMQIADASANLPTI